MSNNDYECYLPQKEMLEKELFHVKLEIQTATEVGDDYPTPLEILIQRKDHIIDQLKKVNDYYKKQKKSYYLNLKKQIPTYY